MNKVLDALYNEHKDHDVTLSQKVIRNIGLIVDQVLLKCGSAKVPCIIYSTSMVKARIIARMNDEILEELNKHKNNVSLRFTFFVKTQSQTISFYMNSKVINSEEYDGNRPDFYYISLEFTKRPPDDLIDILGNYITEQQSRHKRAEERVVFNGQENSSPFFKSMENFLFVSGNGKRCVLAEISIFSAKVLISGKPDEYKEGESAMLLMKSEALEGLGEMVGKIGRVDLINREEGMFSVIIVFNQDMIPPVYKMWVAQCIEMIKINPGMK